MAEILTSQINIKISKEDKAKIVKKAQACGLSTGAFIKLLCLKADVKIVKTEK